MVKRTVGPETPSLIAAVLFFVTGLTIAAEVGKPQSSPTADQIQQASANRQETITNNSAGQGDDWWGTATIRDGEAGVLIGKNAPGRGTLFITLTTYEGEPAFRYPMILGPTWNLPPIGYVYITPTRLVSVPSSQANRRARKFDQAALNVARSANPGIGQGQSLGSVIVTTSDDSYFEPDWSGAESTLEWKEYRQHDDSKSNYKSYVREAEAGRNHDEEVFRAWWWTAWKDFGDAEKQFTELTAKAFVPVTAEEQASFDHDESAGDIALQANQAGAALEQYIRAFSDLPPKFPPPDLKQRVQERIVKAAGRMNPPAPIPEEASRHFAYALAAIDEGKNTHDLSKLDDAISQLEKTLQIAPWATQAYYNLGYVFEMRERYADSLRNFKLYLLAAPNAPDADAVQQKIYQLEYKSGAR
jgi:tetratricopeptide (TPR) repeat protein